MLIVMQYCCLEVYTINIFAEVDTGKLIYVYLAVPFIDAICCPYSPLVETANILNNRTSSIRL